MDPQWASVFWAIGAVVLAWIISVEVRFAKFGGGLTDVRGDVADVKRTMESLQKDIQDTKATGMVTGSDVKHVIDTQKQVIESLREIRRVRPSTEADA